MSPQTDAPALGARARELRGAARRATPLGAVGLAAALLAGCASAPALSDVSPADAAAARGGVADGYWQHVQENYPELERPMVEVVQPTLRDDWPAVLGRCLEGEGVEGVSVRNGGLGVGGDADFRAVGLALYTCVSRFPPVDDPIDLLSDRDLAARWAFDVNVRAACLERLGVDVVVPGLGEYLEAARAGGVDYGVDALTLSRCPAPPEPDGAG